MINLFGEEHEIPEITKATRANESKYQKYRRVYDYRKSLDADRKCKFCKRSIRTHFHDKTYRKCELLGISNSEATDINANYVCNNFKKDGND